MSAPIPTIFGMPRPEPQQAENTSRPLQEAAAVPEVFSRANAGEKLNIRDTGLDAIREAQQNAEHFRDTVLGWGGPIRSSLQDRARAVEQQPQQQTNDRGNER